MIVNQLKFWWLNKQEVGTQYCLFFLEWDLGFSIIEVS